MNKCSNIGIVRVELNKMTSGYVRVMKDTISHYRDTVHYLADVVCDRYNEFENLSSQDSLTLMESFVHHTKDNPNPEYKDFDLLHYKLPSYIRRSAIHCAIGHVSSHYTRSEQYNEKRDVEISRGHHYKKMQPKYNPSPNVFPTLYNKQSFAVDIKNCQVKIKVYIRNTWDWITVGIPSRDAKYLTKAMSCGKVLNPKLVYAYHKFYLEFPVKYNTASFPETPLLERKVLGVDLGLKNPAVLSLIDIFGTVHERRFSPLKADMDRIYHIVNLIRKYQKLSGKGQSLSSLYTKLKGLKENYVKQLAHFIVQTAIDAKAYGIVLEHLSNIHKGGKKSLGARTHHWCVAKIRDYVYGLAFRYGIRVFLINPNGTSKYAFDGSGVVVRDKNNYSKCTFKTGKQYNCDLSASYNIGARYFLREIKKSISATVWLEVSAKVPRLLKRTEWTLATLKSLYPKIKELPECP